MSRKVYSVREYFALVYQLAKHEKFSEFCQTEDFKSFNFQYASKVESLVLEKNKIKNDFEVGDAVLLDKFVWHKGCPLKEGALPSRMAYVMRFADSQAPYSKALSKGVYFMLEAIGKDIQSDLGYQLANLLDDGDTISKLPKISIYH